MNRIMRMGRLPSSLEAIFERSELTVHSLDNDGSSNESYLCAFVPTGDNGLQISGWRAAPRYHATPVIAIADEPVEDRFLQSLVAGADDLLLAGDQNGLQRRLAALAERPPVERTNARCADGLDNDLDGYIDCEDYQCADDPACGAAPEYAAPFDG